MKKITLFALILCIFISCSDDNGEVLPPKTTTLVPSSPEILFSNSLTGSAEGGISGLELDEYVKRQLASAQPTSISQGLDNASITFTEGSDSVRINGFIRGAYVDRDTYIGTGAWSMNNASLKYKFEDDKFMVYLPNDEDDWVIVGYGDQNKIEMYLDSKSINIRMLFAGQEAKLDDFYWEAGSTGFTTLISVTPEAALATTERGWSSFFEEINTVWPWIPATKTIAELYKDESSFKQRSDGASWVIMKVVYQPSVE